MDELIGDDKNIPVPPEDDLLDEASQEIAINPSTDEEKQLGLSIHDDDEMEEGELEDTPNNSVTEAPKVDQKAELDKKRLARAQRFGSQEPADKPDASQSRSREGSQLLRY